MALEKVKVYLGGDKPHVYGLCTSGDPKTDHKIDIVVFPGSHRDDDLPNPANDLLGAEKGTGRLEWGPV